MARKAVPSARPRARTAGKKFKKKVCIFCQEKVECVDYKDVNLLRRFMSDRAKIRARRVGQLRPAPARRRHRDQDRP